MIELDWGINTLNVIIVPMSSNYALVCRNQAVLSHSNNERH